MQLSFFEGVSLDFDSNMCQIILVGQISTSSQSLLQLFEALVLDVAIVEIDNLDVLGSVVFCLD